MILIISFYIRCYRGVVHFIACKDAETWCGFVKNSALCSTYEIGIKICPKSCQKCEGNFL